MLFISCAAAIRKTGGDDGLKMKRWLNDPEKMRKKLQKVDELMAWHSAVFEQGVFFSENERKQYLVRNRQVLLELAWAYRKHSAMERAFFAYILQKCEIRDKNGGSTFAGPLLSYLENSTVYCRENVLQALYVLGEPEPVGQAFDYMGSRNWYHNPRLISDGLMNYPGDKEEMVWYYGTDIKNGPMNLALPLFSLLPVYQMFFHGNFAGIKVRNDIDGDTFCVDSIF